MNNVKSEYLLLFRGTDWDKGLSPEELQKATGQFMSWFERLRQQGTVKAGQPLENQGRIISMQKGRSISDGPFVESKEAIGGYFLLVVDDLDQAVEIAKQCPVLPYGLSVEVRPVADQCAIMKRAGLEMAHAGN